MRIMRDGENGGNGVEGEDDVRKLNEDLSAYYYLLETQCQYKLYMPIRSDSVISIAETYYRKTGDKEKLARSLFYKSGVLSDIGKKAEALQCLKQAEVLVRNLSEDYLSHNVYYQPLSIHITKSTSWHWTI